MTPTKKKETVLDRPIRSFRIVEIHDMWIAAMTLPRPFLWAQLDGKTEQLQLELARRNEMIKEINSEIFERALAVRSAPPGAISEPVKVNALEAAKRMRDRSVAIMIAETKTDEAALMNHRGPGDTTRVNACSLDGRQVIDRKDRKDHINAKKKALMDKANARTKAKLGGGGDGTSVGHKEDGTPSAEGAGGTVTELKTKHKKKKKGQPEEETKMVHHRHMTKDVNKRAVEYFLRLNVKAKKKAVVEQVFHEFDFNRYEERLPSVFALLFAMMADPIVQLWRQYKDYFKQSEDRMVLEKRLKAEQQERENSFYVRRIQPAIVDLKDSLSMMYNFRNQFKKHDTAKGRKAAIVLQRYVRGYHMRKVLADMKYGIRAILRVKSALKIQSVVRRFSDKRLVKNLRKLRHYAALSIQRVMRSFLCRQFLLFDRAARKVTGFMRLVYQTRWTAAVHAVSDLKKNLNENEIAAITIQCFIRRFLAGRLVSDCWSIVYICPIHILFTHSLFLLA